MAGGNGSGRTSGRTFHSDRDCLPLVPLLDDVQIPRSVASWEFNPYKELGEKTFLIGGDRYATVGKNSLMQQHHVALPTTALGRITWIAPAGRYSLKNTVLELDFQGVKKSFTIEDALEHRIMEGGHRSNDSESEAGFAKLVGENFEHVMQMYSITLGRRSADSDDIIDFSSVGGRNISRLHAKIEYDFEDRCFYLEVIGKNGLFIQGHLLRPDGNAPLRVPLQSRDFIQIGDVDFYFVLPVESTVQQLH